MSTVSVSGVQGFPGAPGGYGPKGEKGTVKQKAIEMERIIVCSFDEMLIQTLPALQIVCLSNY